MYGCIIARISALFCIFVLATTTKEAEQNVEVIKVLPSELDPNRAQNLKDIEEREKLLNLLKHDVHSENLESWPPAHVKENDSAEKWPGHLKPIGSVGRTGEPHIYIGFPDAETFWSNKSLHSSPSLFGKAVTDSSAFKNWKNISYFAKFPHSATVWVDAVLLNGTRRAVSFRNFVKNTAGNHHFLQQNILSFLLNEINLPPLLGCDCLKKSLSNHRLLFSLSELHGSFKRNEGHALTCVATGSLDLVFTPPTELISRINYQDIDVQSVDYERFPSLRFVEYHVVTVRAGNCLYIPKDWFYQENTKERTIAFSLEWTDLFGKNGKNCSLDCSAPVGSLYSYNFSDVTIPDHIDNVLLHYFANYISDGRKLDFAAFKKELKKDPTLLDNMTKWTKEYTEITKELFEVLDVNKDKEFSDYDLEVMTPQLLKELKGLLEDRVEDYEDIMIDQQEEKQLEAEKEAKRKMVADRYIKSLENVVKETIDEVKKDPEGIKEEVRKAQEKAAAKLTSTLEEKFKQAGDSYDADLKEMMKQFKGLVESAEEADKLMKDLEGRVKEGEGDSSASEKRHTRASDEESPLKKDEL